LSPERARNMHAPSCTSLSSWGTFDPSRRISPFGHAPTTHWPPHTPHKPFAGELGELGTREPSEPFPQTWPLGAGGGFPGEPLPFNTLSSSDPNMAALPLQESAAQGAVAQEIHAGFSAAQEHLLAKQRVTAPTPQSAFSAPVRLAPPTMGARTLDSRGSRGLSSRTPSSGLFGSHSWRRTARTRRDDRFADDNVSYGVFFDTQRKYMEPAFQRSSADKSFTPTPSMSATLQRYAAMPHLKPVARSQSVA